MITIFLLPIIQAPMTQSVANNDYWKSQSTEALKRAVRHTDKQAQYELGRRYEVGDGVKPNINKAIRWYKRAARFDVRPRYVYSGPVGKEKHGRSVEAGQPTVIPGVLMAQERLKMLERRRQSGIAPDGASKEISQADHRYNYLTASVKSLLDAAGIDLDHAVEEKAYEIPIQLDIMGLKGNLKAVLDECKDNTKVSRANACTVKELSFRANFPPSRCVGLEDIELYLNQNGWKRYEALSSSETRSVLNNRNSLPPILEVFKNPQGVTLSVGPYVKQGCVTHAILSNF